MLIELLTGSVPELHYRDPETGCVRYRVSSSLRLCGQPALAATVQLTLQQAGL